MEFCRPDIEKCESQNCHSKCRSLQVIVEFDYKGHLQTKARQATLIYLKKKRDLLCLSQHKHGSNEAI